LSSALSGKKILVTGAGGFIGSHLVEALVEIGANVRAMTHYNSRGDIGWLDSSAVTSEIELISGDVSDASFMQRAVQGQEVVFNLAALIGIPYSYVAPDAYVRTNIIGTTNVLDACRSEGVSRLVQTSTSETYGSAVYVPMDETHPTQAQSPYSASKIAADALSYSYFSSFDLPVTILRPFNTYGPRQSQRAVIPTIITKCLAGQDVELGNLSPTRDMNYVADTVDGFIKSGEADGIFGEEINVGSGSDISIGDLAIKIKDIIGNDVQIVSTQNRKRPGASEVTRLQAGNSKAKQLLGWSPSHTLDEGLEKTIAWFSENADLSRDNNYMV
jgi:NAD dependent epimerase/dehydratase